MASQAARVAAHLPPHRASVRGGDPGLARLNLTDVPASSPSFDFAVGLLEGFATRCAKPPRGAGHACRLTQSARCLWRHRASLIAAPCAANVISEDTKSGRRRGCAGAGYRH